MLIEIYCSKCSHRSDKRYCHAGILMSDTKQYCNYYIREDEVRCWRKLRGECSRRDCPYRFLNQMDCVFYKLHPRIHITGGIAWNKTNLQRQEN